MLNVWVHCVSIWKAFYQCLVKAMVFPVVIYGCESWAIKKAEHQRIDAFELWYWRRLLRVHWTARRSNQCILKEISPNIHWKAWCWSWNSNILATWWEELTHWKRPWFWRSLKARWEPDDRGWDGWWEVERLRWEVGWHHWLNGHEFVQALGDGEEQGSLAYCSPWGHKDSDTIEQLNN